MDNIKVVPQQAEADCGIACLAMLLGLSYADVYLEVAKVDVRRSKRGLYLTQIKKVAKALGHTLVFKRKYDPEEATGILAVTFPSGPDHVLLVWNGILIDTDATIWTWDGYMALNEATPTSLLVLKE